MKQPHQYRPLEQQPQHDACGIGAVVNISGQRTHETLDGALKIVEKLAHRTGKDADGTTGDGVGVMTQLPHALFQKAAQQAGQTLPDAGDYGAAMIFFPQDPLKRMRSRKLLEMILSREGLELLFWRDVPVCPEILSEKARSSMPYIAQCFIRRPDTAARGLDFDRRLYLARREYEHSVSGTYVVSMSSRTIVYKGLFLVWQLRQFYPDLQDADYTSALALVHSRFSTNTTPSGSGRTRTASSSTTARSTPSAATSTGCSPARRRWRPPSSATRLPAPTLSWRPTAPTPPCSTTRWNFSCTAASSCRRP